MNNALLGLAGLLIAVLAALFAVPYFVDWNGYRGMFEEEASRVLGRDVRVGGSVDVRLLPVPYVSFAKVRVADTANDTGDPFFRADSFTMWLSVSPLLRGRLEARRIELARPVLRLVVDAKGAGNWSTITPQPGALPFVPSNVALQSVRLRDGEIQIVRGQGGVAKGTLAEIEGVDGELEAETLDGPFRFKGSAQWQGEARDVRAATSRLDDQGGVRLKANVHVPATGNSYTLDGGVADIRHHPRLEGELTARIGLGAGASAKAAAKVGEQPLLDGKGHLEADGTGFRLRDIAASLDNVGQPQLLSGQAQMAWVGKPLMEARLASRLLDLDRIAGAAGKPSSALDAARGMVVSAVGLLPAEADATVGLDVDQATLGGDSISALSVVLQRAAGQLELKQLRAGVPGGGRVDLAGKLTLSAAGKVHDDKPHSDKPQSDKAADGKPAEKSPGDGKPSRDTAMALDGTAVVRGTSLVRFLAWAAPNVTAAVKRPDSAFLLAGRVRADDRALEITEATGELGSVPLKGSARLELGERRRIAVSLDGRQINLGQLWPEAFAGGVGRATLDRVLPGLGARLGLPASPPVTPAADSDGKAARSAPLLDLATTDIDARIEAGELLAGPDVLNDVAADLSIDHGRLSLRRLRATTADKLTLDVAGDLADAAVSAKGVLRWTADAPSASAVGALMELAGAEGPAEARQARFAVLAPLRLAGALAVSQRGAASSDLALDGLAGGGRIVARIESDAAPAGWRTAHLDAMVRLDGGNTLGLLRTALPEIAVGGRGEEIAGGNVLLKAVGVPDKGLVTLATLDGEQLDLVYDGRWQLAADGRHKIDGTWQAKSADARRVLALAGVPAAAGAASVAFDGRGTIAADGDAITLSARQLKLGASGVTGRVVLKRESGKAQSFDADLDVDQTSIAGVLAGFTAQGAATATAEAAAVAMGGGGAGTVWPQGAFDARVLDGLTGHAVVRFGRLAASPGLGLADGLLEARFTPGRIDVTRIEGPALGGKLAVNGSLDKASGVVRLKGRLVLDGLDLAALGSPEREAAAKGSAKVTLDLEGSGGSPAAIVGALTGHGEAAIAGAEISGFVPSTLSALAEAAIAGKGERAGDGLAKAVREAIGQGRFKMAAAKVPLEVVDGSVKSKPLVIESDVGRTTFASVVELPSLRFEADWQVEAKGPKPADGKPDKGMLPPVEVVYVGKLKEMGAVEPRLDVSRFERELDVRKLEHDVEELERLRKADEERARAEAERQKALEAERLKAAEEERAKAAAAAASSGGVAPAPVPAATPGADGKPPEGASNEPANAQPVSSSAKPGDWKTTETPAQSPPKPPAAEAEARPKPRPAAPLKPKPLAPDAVFKPF